MKKIVKSKKEINGEDKKLENSIEHRNNYTKNNKTSI